MKMSVTSFSEVDGSTPAGLVGLENFANNCYLNATLQCLCRSISFQMFFLRKTLFQGPLTFQLAMLTTKMMNAKNSVYNPVMIKTIFGNHHHSFQGTSHQDAHEFLLLLLNCVHSEIITDRLLPESDRNFIKRNFYTEEVSVLTCTGCGRSGVTNTLPTPIISVPLPEASFSFFLSDCLKQLTMPSPVENYQCGDCQSVSLGLQKLYYTGLPPTLILHLKRFSFDGKNVIKDRRPVQCPLQWVPQELLAEGVLCPKYNLLGFICHYGEFSGQGHYKAFCKITGRWFLFDDKKVNEVPKAELDTTSAYLLFYSMEEGMSAGICDSLSVPVATFTNQATEKTAAVKPVLGKPGKPQPTPPPREIILNVTQAASRTPQQPGRLTATSEAVKASVPGSALEARSSGPSFHKPSAGVKFTETVRQPAILHSTQTAPQEERERSMASDAIEISQVAEEDLLSQELADSCLVETVTVEGESDRPLLSKYAQNLKGDILQRYLTKIAVIGNVDPYTFEKRISGYPNPDVLPDVAYGDIYNYYVLKTSSYTFSDFKAYKSLDAFNASNCGWVRAICVEHLSGYVLIMGKVLHSQKLRDPPLIPWIISTENGEVLSAHCTCMAGLGESCTHTAAVLFEVEKRVRIRQSLSVTEVPAYWTAPSQKTVPFSKVRDIDFSVPQKKSFQSLVPAQTRSKKAKIIPSPTSLQQHELLRAILDKGQVAAAHCVTLPFCAELNQRDIDARLKYPKDLSEFYNDVYRGIPSEQLTCVGLSFNLTVTETEASALEKSTKKQSSSALWFRGRAGRVTASKFKSVCRTNINAPALSTIKAICYPEKSRFSTEATRYGCRHEKTAQRSYANMRKLSHPGFVLEMSGLIINPEYPHFGASPDGLVCCHCCGEGCVEVKCPHCLRNKGKEDIITSKTCLVVSSDGTARLDENHAYYYQVQMQIFLSRRKYCDFVLWTPKSVFIQRILPDQEFWDRNSQIATDFFFKVIFPELLGKCYTEPSASLSNECVVLCSPKTQVWKVTIANSPNADVQGKKKSEDDITVPVVCSPRSLATQWTVSQNTLSPPSTSEIQISPVTEATKWKVTTSSSGSRHTLSTKPSGVFPLPRNIPPKNK